MLFVIPIVSLLGFAALDFFYWRFMADYLTIPIMSTEKIIFYILIATELVAEIVIVNRISKLRKNLLTAHNKKILRSKKKSVTVTDVAKIIAALESKRLETYLSKLRKYFADYENLKAVLISSLSMLFEEGQYTYDTYSATIEQMDAVIVRISLSFITFFEAFDEVNQKEQDEFAGELLGKFDEISVIFATVLTKLKSLLVQLAKLEHLSVEEFKALGSVVELENLIRNTALYKDI
jgi:tRNA splicing endonuclease